MAFFSFSLFVFCFHQINQEKYRKERRAASLISQKWLNIGFLLQSRLLASFFRYWLRHQCQPFSWNLLQCFQASTTYESTGKGHSRLTTWHMPTCTYTHEIFMSNDHDMKCETSLHHIYVLVGREEKMEPTDTIKGAWGQEKRLKPLKSALHRERLRLFFLLLLLFFHFLPKKKLFAALYELLSIQNPLPSFAFLSFGIFSPYTSKPINQWSKSTFPKKSGLTLKTYWKIDHRTLDRPVVDGAVSRPKLWHTSCDLWLLSWRSLSTFGGRIGKSSLRPCLRGLRQLVRINWGRTKNFFFLPFRLHFLGFEPSSGRFHLPKVQSADKMGKNWRSFTIRVELKGSQGGRYWWPIDAAKNWRVTDFCKAQLARVCLSG